MDAADLGGFAEEADATRAKIVKASNIAVGQFAIAAAERVMELCRVLRVSFCVAPYEAETQPVGLLHEGKISKIIAFDSRTTSHVTRARSC